MGVVTSVAGRPAERSLSYNVTTTEKRCLFITITDQLMASSTPRYGTHAHKSRWKISPWTVSSSLSRSWIAHGRSAEGRVCVCALCAITSSRLAWRRLLRSPVPVWYIYRDMKIKTTKINSEGLLRLFMKFSIPENYPLYGSYTLDNTFAFRSTCRVGTMWLRALGLPMHACMYIKLQHYILVNTQCKGVFTCECQPVTSRQRKKVQLG